MRMPAGSGLSVFRLGVTLGDLCARSPLLKVYMSLYIQLGLSQVVAALSLGYWRESVLRDETQIRTL